MKNREKLDRKNIINAVEFPSIIWIPGEDERRKTKGNENGKSKNRRRKKR